MRAPALLIFAFMAFLTMVIAIPLDLPVRDDLSAEAESVNSVTEDIEFYDEDAIPKRNVLKGCARGHKFCGRCNGTSCKMALVNLPCSKGTCVKQRGGGDGKYCGGPRTGYLICPGW